jgi:hypothetical protein
MVMFVAVLLAAVWIFTAILGLGLFMAAARGDRELVAVRLGTSPGPVARAEPEAAVAPPSIRFVA